MKQKKNYYSIRDERDEEERENANKGKKRRPIRNWTKAYTQHLNEAEEIDDFFVKHKKK